MSKLWLPEGLSDAAIEVFIDLEYARSKRKPLSTQYQRALEEGEKLSLVISELTNIVKNLKTRKTKIVSLGEFNKILQSLDRAQKVQRSNRSAVAEYLHGIERLDESILRLERELEKLKRTGKVLEFNGKKRKR